jgi:hypothetical protein
MNGRDDHSWGFANTWKEAALGYLKALSRPLPGERERERERGETTINPH